MQLTHLLMQLLAIVAPPLAAVDYCKLGTCQYKHIACHHNGTFAYSCPPSAYLVDLREYQPFILRLFNQLRNQVAGGHYSDLSKAARMAEMQWCYELAHLAKLNALRCKLRTDKCRATTHFPQAGQSVAVYSYAGPEHMYQLDELLKEQIELWFAEGKNINKEIINSYPTKDTMHSFGNFTRSITDHNTHIGCAALRFFKDFYNHFYLVCNFATDNVPGRPVYATANMSAIGCSLKYGTSNDYTNLCHHKEQYHHALILY